MPSTLVYTVEALVIDHLRDFALGLEKYKVVQKISM